MNGAVAHLTPFLDGGGGTDTRFGPLASQGLHWKAKGTGSRGSCCGSGRGLVAKPRGMPTDPRRGETVDGALQDVGQSGVSLCVLAVGARTTRGGGRLARHGSPAAGGHRLGAADLRNFAEGAWRAGAHRFCGDDSLYICVGGSAWSEKLAALLSFALLSLFPLHVSECLQLAGQVEGWTVTSKPRNAEATHTLGVGSAAAVCGVPSRPRGTTAGVAVGGWANSNGARRLLDGPLHASTAHTGPACRLAKIRPPRPAALTWGWPAPAFHTGCCCCCCHRPRTARREVGNEGGWGGSTRCGSGVTRVHACECWHLKGGLGGRRKVGGRGGEAGVGRADGSPRATGYTPGSPTPEVTRSGGGGLSRPPPPPTTSGSSFFSVFC